VILMAASNGSVPQRREQRAVGRWEHGLTLGWVVGAVAGVAAGLVIGSIAFETGAALMAAALGGAIFGAVVGAFLGGMSKLEDPPPGQEPGTRDQPLERPGLTHDERDR
jgi:membrane associated rhomboid family serine protease